MEAGVKKEGDAIRLLNQLKKIKVQWLCCPALPDIDGIELAWGSQVLEDVVFTSLVQSTERRTIQILRVEEREVHPGLEPQMAINMSDATVTVGRTQSCNCGLMVCP